LRTAGAIGSTDAIGKTPAFIGLMKLFEASSGTNKSSQQDSQRSERKPHIAWSLRDFRFSSVARFSTGRVPG
jgi:hypothetical protein